MGYITFIESLGNPQPDFYRAIKEQYERLFVRYEPESVKMMVMATTPLPSKENNTRR